MKHNFIRMLVLVLIGAVAGLVLQWSFVRAWPGYYSKFPWRGYEQAMSSGQVPAFLTTSPRSLVVGAGALFGLPLLTLWISRGRSLQASLALWAGVMASLIGVWVATPQLRQASNLWPIDLVCLLGITGVPLMAAALLLAIIQKARRTLHRVR